MKMLLATVMILTALSAWAEKSSQPVAGNEGGHGGHPNALLAAAQRKARIAQQFTAIGREVKLDFENWGAKQFSEVKVADINSILSRIERGEITVDPTTEELRKDGVTKLAMNFPDSNLIRVNEDLWDQWWKKNRLVLKAIFLHECLPFRHEAADHYEIKDYENSSDYYLAMKNHKQTPFPSKTATQSKLTGPDVPVLLTQFLFDQSKAGMEMAEANRQCKTQQILYRNRFYYVYCVFLDKNWSEIQYREDTYTDYRYLGQASSSQSGSQNQGSSQNSQAALYLSNGYRSAGGSVGQGTSQNSGSSQSSSNSQPVIAQVDVPFNYQVSVEQKIYGLRVYGWGRPGKNAPWMTVIDSTNLLDGDVSDAPYEDSDDAMDACMEVISTSGDPRMVGSKCVVKRKGNGFVYSILSKSPIR